MEQQNDDFLKYLLDIGIDFTLFNDQDHSPLHKSAYKGLTSVCEWIILNIPSYKDSLIKPDKSGLTASEAASQNGYEQLSLLLLKHVN